MSGNGRFCCKSRLARMVPVNGSTEDAGRLGSAGLEALYAELLRYAMHLNQSMAAVGRPTMRAAAGSARWPREQTHPGRLAGPRSRSRPSFRMRFRCANRILDLLALTSRCLEALGASEHDRATSRAHAFMYVARDFARWFFWTALRFERTYIAVELACAIQKCLALSVHGAARSEPLSSRAAVDVAGRIISKVAARRRCHHPASTCRTQGYVARCPSPRPASSASELHRKRYRRQAAPA